MKNESPVKGPYSVEKGLPSVVKYLFWDWQVLNSSVPLSTSKLKETIGTGYSVLFSETIYVYDNILV